MTTTRTATSDRRKVFRRLAGYTLVELMVSLSIFGFSATAISSLMFATYNTNRVVRTTVSDTAEAEIALRRMIEHVRSANDVLYDPATGLMIQTPPDSSSLSYIYIYYIAQGNLRERIQTAGSLTLIQDNAIVDNLATFSVHRVGTTVPRSWQISITLTGSPPITRSATVTSRNLNN